MDYNGSINEALQVSVLWRLETCKFRQTSAFTFASAVSS